MARRPGRIAARTLKLLPPFRLLPGRAISAGAIFKAHVFITGALYTIFFAISGAERTLLIPDGIGVIENPPFFAHLVLTAVSIPLVLWIVQRIQSRFDVDGLVLARASYFRLLKKSNISVLLFAVATLFGIISLATTVVMSIQAGYNIYDSSQYPASATFYNIIRIYQFLICYPSAVAIPPILFILFFRALRSGELSYQPFSPDGSGGLRKYLKVADRPVYIIQSVSVLIALANYLGWQEFGVIPAALATGTVVLITLLAFILFSAFYRLKGYLQNVEVLHIRKNQAGLYSTIRTLSPEPGLDKKAVIDEIEAGDRLVSIIYKNRNLGWIKYVFNFSIAMAAQAVGIIARNTDILEGKFFLHFS